MFILSQLCSYHFTYSTILHFREELEPAAGIWDLAAATKIMSLSGQSEALASDPEPVEGEPPLQENEKPNVVR